MDTYFAPAERAQPAVLSSQIRIVSDAAMLSGLLRLMNGLIAVVNEHRQVVAVNDSFLKTLGINDARSCLGLRPGEIVGCVHSDGPGGCGTGITCRSCGAVIAMLAALETNESTEEKCALTVSGPTGNVDMAMIVRATPFVLDDRRFLLLFLQDDSVNQKRAVLERTFFHDINNTLQILLGTAGLLKSRSPSPYAVAIHEITLRLVREVEIQRMLTSGRNGDVPGVFRRTTLSAMLDNLDVYFEAHESARGKTVHIANRDPDISVATDSVVVQRVLTNMVLNALEASNPGDTVTLNTDYDEENVTFKVWNRVAIPADIQPRIFQRNFSTKTGTGRGIGTYSMKLFGEAVLGGSVSFSSSPTEGTEFRLTIPRYSKGAEKWRPDA